MEVEAAFGVEDGARTSALRPPADLAGGEFGRYGTFLVGSVNRVAEQDLAAQRVRHVAFEVDLLGGDSVAGGRQVHQPGAEAARIGAVDVVAAADGHRDVRRPAACLSVAPQEPAGLGIDADHAFVEELHVLFAAGGLDDGGRSVSGGLAARHGGLPDDVAGLLVQRHQCGPCSARCGHEHVAIDQRRFGIGPGAGLSAEIAAQALAPEHLSGRCFQTREVAVGTLGVKPVAFDRGSGAGHGIGRLLVRVADVAQARGPDGLAVLDRKGVDELVLHAAIAHYIEAAAHHRGRAVALADIGELPEQLRALFGPLREQAGFLRDPVALRAAKLRPIPGPQCSGEDSSGEQHPSALHSRHPFIRLYAGLMKFTGRRASADIGRYFPVRHWYRCAQPVRDARGCRVRGRSGRRRRCAGPGGAP